MDFNFSTFGYKGVQYVKNLNDIVKTQIMDFLDPDKRVVYNLFKEGTLSEHNLYTISSDNYIKTMPYSTDIDINFKYNKQNNLKISYKNNKVELEEETVNDILPFHLSSHDNDIEGFNSGCNTKVNIKSSDNFEDDVNNMLSTEIQNVYLENGTSTDIDNNSLIGDTIYKEVNGNLEILKNPPYKVYDIGNGLNSLVSIENSVSASAGDSKYLRITGNDPRGDKDDNDSQTAIEFAGGKLRTVSYNRFKDL